MLSKVGNTFPTISHTSTQKGCGDNFFPVQNSLSSGSGKNVIGATYGSTTLIQETPRNRLWKRARQELLNTELDGLGKQQITALLNNLNSAYDFAKQHFHYKDLRDDGARYFKHLFRSTEILLDTCKNPTILKLVCTLLHDVVENTDHVYPESLITLFNNEIFGKKVALCVALMSKKSVKQIAEMNGDKATLKKIARFEDISQKQVAERGSEYRIINDKGFLTRFFKNRRINNELSIEENTLYDEYQTLKNEKSKEIQSEYFGRYENSEDMKEAAIKFNEDMGLWLPQECIPEIVETTLDSKDAERLDNLRTEQFSSKGKRKKKIIEFNRRFRSRLEREKPEFLEKCDQAIRELNKIDSTGETTGGVKEQVHALATEKA